MFFSTTLIGAAVVAVSTAYTYTPPIKPVYNETYCTDNSTVEFPGIIPLSEMPAIFSDPSGTQNPEDYVQIRNTAMLYSLHMDGKNFDLGDLFTENVVANLSQGPVITGLVPLQIALQASLAAVTSHHDLGTQYIDIADSGCTAVSITYFHASLLGVGPSYGQVCSSSPLLLSALLLISHFADRVRLRPVPRQLGEAVCRVENC